MNDHPKLNTEYFDAIHNMIMHGPARHAGVAREVFDMFVVGLDFAIKSDNPPETFEDYMKEYKYACKEWNVQG